MSPLVNPYTAADRENIMVRVEASMWRVGWRRDANLPEVVEVPVKGDTPWP